MTSHGHLYLFIWLFVYLFIFGESSSWVILIIINSLCGLVDQTKKQKQKKHPKLYAFQLIRELSWVGGGGGGGNISKNMLQMYMLKNYIYSTHLI